MAEEQPAQQEGETGNGPGGHEGGEPSVAALREQLEEANLKAEENGNQVLRIRAELENLRKRHDRELEAAHRYALEKFVTELLPVVDSLELGMAAAAEGKADAQKLHEGVELTLRQLLSVFKKNGIASVDPHGEPFDPEQHQAMMTQESAKHDPNTVVSVMQKGYRLNDRLVRPAMVAVSKPPEGTTPNIDEKA